jgi:hypothetical protein
MHSPQNAGVVIDGDGQGGVVFAAGDGAFCEARMGDAGGVGERFEFAITGLLLAGAGGGVVGHEEFEDGLAGAEDFGGLRVDLHAGVDRADARGG